MESSKSILVIDDDPYILKFLKTVLEQESFIVHLASDGVYGLQLAKENVADLVLLDINMPGPDGYQVIQSIREHSSIPVIMLTGLHSVDTVKMCLDLGADDYLTKPFKPAELLARIRSKLR